jgi:hypothetical protein
MLIVTVKARRRCGVRGVQWAGVAGANANCAPVDWCGNNRTECITQRRIGPVVAAAVFAGMSKRVRIRLAGETIPLIGRNISVEALAAQLVIRRCLTHARHRRRDPAHTVVHIMWTTGGDCAPLVDKLWRLRGQAANDTKSAGPISHAQ